MSKMGISVISSYRGGCNFETVGLSRTVASEYFPGVLSKISGIGLIGIEKKLRIIHKEAFEGMFFQYYRSVEFIDIEKMVKSSIPRETYSFITKCCWVKFL